MPKAWQDAPLVEPEVDRSQVAEPLPGIPTPGAEDPDRELSNWEMAPIVNDDTSSIYNPNNKQEDDLSFLGKVGSAVNFNLAELMGAPVDLANLLVETVTSAGRRDPETGERVKGLGAEEPVGGSTSLKRLFNALGIAPDPEEGPPEGLATDIGEMTAFGAAFLVPFAKPVSQVAKVATKVRPVPRTTSGKIVHKIASDAVENPLSFMAYELSASVLAGTGVTSARTLFPESDAAEAIGALIGGVTPAGVVIGTKTVFKVSGAKLAKSVLSVMTKKAGTRRAKARMQAVARDPEKARAALAEDPTAIEVEAGITIAQRTADEGLLGLELAVIRGSEKLKDQSDSQIARATAVIRKALTDFGEGVPVEKAEEAIASARAYLTELLDIRLRVAARQADEAIAKLAPGATKAEANLIAKESIEDALDDFNKQLDDLFADVPLEVTVKADRSRNAITKMIEGTPLAQQDDIPEVAVRLLGEGGPLAEGDISIKELQGLRSKLLQNARLARAAGEFNKARLNDDMAEIILKDMGAGREVEKTGPGILTRAKPVIPGGPQLRRALDFAADGAERFRKGIVGKLLRPSKEGGDAIPGALTLETTVGKGGPRAAFETQQLEKAVAESAAQPKLRGAIEDFLLSDFERRVIRDGKVDPTKAKAFMERHRDTLEDFPELAKRFEEAITTGKAVTRAAERAERAAKGLIDPKVSRAAVFMKEPVDDGMKRVAKLPASKAGEAMEEMVKQVGRDPTGDALKGLKTGFGDFFIDLAETGVATIEGKFIMAGTVMKRALEKGPVREMAHKLFSPDELKRLDEIVGVAIKLEKGVKAVEVKGGIIKDAPSLIFNTLAGVFGAKAGRALKTGTIQVPAFIANLFRKVQAKLTIDPGRKLLIDLVQDESLFSALLQPSNDISPVARRRLNAWAASLLEEAGEEAGEIEGPDILGAISSIGTAEAGEFKTKEGVSFEGLEPEIRSAGDTVQNIIEEAGADFVITSTTEGKHKKGSLHPAGQAIDVRSRDLDKKAQKQILADLKEALGDDYDVLLEKDHFHIEYDPKE